MRRILLVDDEPHIIRVMKLALERASYQVFSAANGELGLARIKECAPDVVITDIDMPVMSGDELCRRIQVEIPERKFLIMILTSRAEIEHRQWSCAISNLMFLEKPVSIRRLVGQLEDYFAETDPCRGDRIAG